MVGTPGGKGGGPFGPPPRLSYGSLGGAGGKLMSRGSESRGGGGGWRCRSDDSLPVCFSSRFRLPQTIHPRRITAIVRIATMPARISIKPRSGFDRTVTWESEVAEFPAASVTVNVA